MQKITPFLWFDDNAEEAVNFYTTVFKESEIKSITRYDEAAAEATGRSAGSIMTASFILNGQEFVALNAGPHFKFTEAISFVINCKTQEEVDYYWEKLTEGGGQPGNCGWLKDRFGLSWQVVPTLLSEIYAGKDKGKAKRVMSAMLKMHKPDIKQLQEA